LRRRQLLRVVLVGSRSLPIPSGLLRHAPTLILRSLNPAQVALLDELARLLDALDPSAS
jgi:hypothetical protein